MDDINVIRDSIAESFLAYKAPDSKAHVVVDYKDSFIAQEVCGAYWEMVQKVQDGYYLSASHFYVSSFGVGLCGGSAVATGLKPALADTTTA
jgi:hypothetical protein